MKTTSYTPRFEQTLSSILDESKKTKNEENDEVCKCNDSECDCNKGKCDCKDTKCNDKKCDDKQTVKNTKSTKNKEESEKDYKNYKNPKNSEEPKDVISDNKDRTQINEGLFDLFRGKSDADKLVGFKNKVAKALSNIDFKKINVSEDELSTIKKYYDPEYVSDFSVFVASDDEGGTLYKNIKAYIGYRATSESNHGNFDIDENEEKRSNAKCAYLVIIVNGLHDASKIIQKTRMIPIRINYNEEDIEKIIKKYIADNDVFSTILNRNDSNEKNEKFNKMMNLLRKGDDISGLNSNEDLSDAEDEEGGNQRIPSFTFKADRFNIKLNVNNLEYINKRLDYYFTYKIEDSSDPVLVKKKEFYLSRYKEGSYKVTNYLISLHKILKQYSNMIHSDPTKIESKGKEYMDLYETITDIDEHCGVKL